MTTPAMMPGRGRMPGGRGMMMPGRGGKGRGVMIPGRGGRGMMPGRGGGRTMMPGRGGRGGRGPMKKIPCKLDVFNRYLYYIMSGYTEREDLENLGFAFPQWTPQPLSPKDQKIRMMKKMAEAKKKEAEKIRELKNPTSETGFDGDSNGDSNGEKADGDTEVPSNTGETDDGDNGKEDATDDNEEETGTVEDTNKPTDPAPVSPGNSEEKSNDDSPAPTKEETSVENEKADPATPDDASDEEKKSDDETGEKSGVDATGDKDETAKPDEPAMDPEKKKELMKKREEAMRLNLTDCETLLAQLNTKRLYRRLKYYKRTNSDYDVDKAYPYNKSTPEISDFEWECLIDDYKARRTEILKKKKIEDAENAEKRAKAIAKRNKKMKNKKGKRKPANRKFKDAKEEGTEEETAQESEEETKSEEVAPVEESDTGCEDEKEVDAEEDENYQYVADKPSKYELLMFTPCPRAVAALASYPRSGNSLMRNLYEKITLRVTGSDMMGGLQKHDLVGEMATGTNNVQFVKTHYPERMGRPPFRVSRAVLLVRNPYDAMDSYFNLMSTSTHTKSLTEEERKKYANVFGEMAKREVLVWRDFHEFWLHQKIPLLVVRYEDLIRDTVKVISKVIRFVLEIKSMTFFEDRILRAIGEEQVENLGPYKARTGGIGKSLTKGYYTPQLLHYINYGIAGTMEKFGYKEMLVPNPKSWKLKPLDQHGVFIPGTTDQPIIINKEGLVRGPARQTNWQAVKMMVMRNQQEARKKNDDTPKPLDLN